MCIIVCIALFRSISIVHKFKHESSIWICLKLLNMSLHCVITNIHKENLNAFIINFSVVLFCKCREWYVRHTSEIKNFFTSILNTFCSVCQTEQRSIMTHSGRRHKTWQVTGIDRKPPHCGFILIICLWIEEPLKILGFILTNWLNSFSYCTSALESLFWKILNSLSFLPRYK
jgi:hypothetical protein